MKLLKIFDHRIIILSLALAAPFFIFSAHEQISIKQDKDKEHSELIEKIEKEISTCLDQESSEDILHCIRIKPDPKTHKVNWNKPFLTYINYLLVFLVLLRFRSIFRNFNSVGLARASIAISSSSSFAIYYIQENYYYIYHPSDYLPLSLTSYYLISFLLIFMLDNYIGWVKSGFHIDRKNRIEK